MISYIRGELAEIGENHVVIDVGGVGYGIFMSGSDMSSLPKTGQEVKIHTYLHVKEDLMQLFGQRDRPEGRSQHPDADDTE